MILMRNGGKRRDLDLANILFQPNPRIWAIHLFGQNFYSIHMVDREILGNATSSNKRSVLFTNNAVMWYKTLQNLYQLASQTTQTTLLMHPGCSGSSVKQNKMAAQTSTFCRILGWNLDFLRLPLWQKPKGKLLTYLMYAVMLAVKDVMSQL